MGPIDERIDAPPVELADQLADREDEPGRARHVADKGQPRSRRHCSEDRLDHLARAADREWHAGYDDPRPVAPGRPPERVQRRVVLVVGGQQLGAGREAERTEDGVHAGRRVRDEDQVVRVGTDERRQRRARLVEQPLELAGQEADRLRLQPVAPALLRLEDGPRAGSERAVVEERDRRVEQPVARDPPTGGRHARHDTVPGG